MRILMADEYAQIAHLYMRYRDIKTLDTFFWREDVYLKLGTGDNVNLNTGKVEQINYDEMVLKAEALIEFSTEP